MKKVIFIFSLLFIFALTSCKNEYQNVSVCDGYNYEILENKEDKVNEVDQSRMDSVYIIDSYEEYEKHFYDWAISDYEILNTISEKNKNYFNDYVIILFYSYENYQMNTLSSILNDDNKMVIIWESNIVEEGKYTSSGCVIEVPKRIMKSVDQVILLDKMHYNN